MRLLFSFFLLLSFSFVHAQADPSAIHVNVVGEGTTTFLLPGFATPGEVFDNTIDSLGEGRAYHVFTYAGFGGTPPIDTPWYPKVRDALIAYVEAKNLSSIDLIGHSMGGNLATEIAARFPERVNHLVILDALPCMRELMMPGVPASAMVYDNPQTMSMFNMDEASFAGMVGGMAGGMTEVPEKVTVLADWMKKADRKTYTFGYVDLLRMDLRPQLAKITAKTIILAAPSFGAELVKSNMESQYENLKDVVIKVAPQGRHFIMWDAETWYLSELRSALVSPTN